ncbi:hypothetical protein ACWCP6_28175 [Streptomyces sp. NPDC002004]
MRQQSNASLPAGESLLDTPAEIAALRADTPDCASVIHFNNVGCGLAARPVLAAMTDHLRPEADTGGYEASVAREVQVRDYYASTADLLGTGPGNIAFAGSATRAYTKALSAIDFRADHNTEDGVDTVAAAVAELAEHGQRTR